MLVVPVLEQLTQLSKCLLTIRTLVGEVRHSAVVVATVSKLRNTNRVAPHRALSVRKVVDLLTSVVCSGTSRTISTLDVLNSVGTR